MNFLLKFIVILNRHCRLWGFFLFDVCFLCCICSGKILFGPSKHEIYYFSKIIPCLNYEPNEYLLADASPKE